MSAPPECRHLVGGRWELGEGETIPVLDPSTEAPVAVLRAASGDRVDATVRAARAAFPAWSQTAVAERAALLEALAERLAAEQDELAALITSEVGTPITLARRVQAHLPVLDLRACAGALRADGTVETIGHSTVVREPAGVVAAVTPWNYPVHQAALKLGAALAAGCTVVLKPSEIAPLAVTRLVELAVAVGVPPGVVGLVHGTGPDVGEALVAHPEVDVVSFTGSTRAGRRVGELAARDVKRTLLELGGKSASLVLDDADVETATKVSLANCFLNGGQTCSAWTRLVVPRRHLDTVVEVARAQAARYVPGDPRDPTTRLGPLVSAAQRDQVLACVRRGIAEGEPVVFDGAGTDLPPIGFHVRPTVFAPVTPTSTVATEEIFGPVLSILAVDDEEEAVAVANSSRYGLHAGVWSADHERAVAVAGRLRAGQVDINGAAHNPHAPFGGVGLSGVGREGGAHGIAEFTETKSIQHPAPVR